MVEPQLQTYNSPGVYVYSAFLLAYVVYVYPGPKGPPSPSLPGAAACTEWLKFITNEMIEYFCHFTDGVYELNNISWDA